MLKLLRISISVIALATIISAGYVIQFFLTDIHFRRGYWFYEVTDQLVSFPTIFDKPDVDMSYEISSNPDGSWRFRFQNNDFSYRYFYAYRNGRKDFDLTDSLFFLCASRYIVVGKTDSLVDDPGFSCGTGLSSIFIRPYEVFEFTTRSLDPMIHFGCLAAQRDDMKAFYVTNDSIDLRFYLPVYAIGAEHYGAVASNQIRIPFDRIDSAHTAYFAKFKE